MHHVRDTILIAQEEPYLEVLDLNGIESYNELTHSLKIDFDKAKKRKVGLLRHPFHFHKLLLLMDFIDKNLAKINSNLTDESTQHFTMKKRTVYYSLVGQGIKSTDELDLYIADICYILQVSRDQLGIEASVKALMAGSGLTSIQTVEYIQIPAYLLNPRNPAHLERFHLTFEHLLFVLIVEKETVFQHVI